MKKLFAASALLALAATLPAGAQSSTGTAPFCLKTSTGQLRCTYGTMGACEDARDSSNLTGQCMTRADAGGVTGLGERPALPSGSSGGSVNSRGSVPD